MQNSNMRATLYCRVACVDEHAIKMQENTLRAYAQENGYDESTVYIDNGASGLHFNRPAFKQMMDGVNAGVISTVIVRDISRIGRGFIEVNKWITEMQTKGVTLISLDGFDIQQHNESEVLGINWIKYFSARA